MEDREIVGLFWARDQAAIAETAVALDELGDVLPDGRDPGRELDGRELSRAIHAFLQSLRTAERNVFISRYWYVRPIAEIARRYGFTESKVRSMLCRTRKKLYLDLLMGVSGGGGPRGDEIAENRPFDSVLGFEDYRVTLEEFLPYQYEWHCWVTIDGEERCVAENVFLFEDGFAAYSVDLDGDGVPELVTNNVFTTGTRRVYVFQYRDGQILRGSPSRDFYRSELGFADVYGENAIEERYDPEAGAFAVTFREGPAWKKDGTLMQS